MAIDFLAWFDVIEMNQQKKDFLQELEHWKYDGNTAKKPFPNHANNPFHNRGIGLIKRDMV